MEMLPMIFHLGTCPVDTTRGIGKREMLHGAWGDASLVTRSAAEMLPNAPVTSVALPLPETITNARYPLKASAAWLTSMPAWLLLSHLAHGSWIGFVRTAGKCCQHVAALTEPSSHMRWLPGCR